MINKTVSQEIAHVLNPIPQMCWYNAVNAFHLFSDDPRLEDASYVEGYAIPTSTGIAVEHGWLKLKNDEEVEVTWLDDEHVHYFPGIEYSFEDILELDPVKLPLVWITGGFGGFQNEAYRKCYYEAMEYRKSH